MSGKAGEIVVDDVLGNDSETGERSEQTENGKGSPDQITADVLKALLFDGNGSESGGCNVLDQVQAGCWTVCDAKSLGLRMAHVTPSTAIRECADGVCAEDARGCWPVLIVASCRTSRENGREKLWWYNWT